MKNKLLLLTLMLGSGFMVYAGGFRVSMQGQRGMAMGHTGVAMVNSAEVLFWNPAGLVDLQERFSISVGISATFSNVSYQNVNTGEFAETDSDVGTPLYLYAAYQVKDWLSVGLGIYTPYGSNVTWPTDWPGSHLVNEIELTAIYIQPVVSIKILPNFSIGGGPIYAIGDVSFNRNANRFLTDLNGNRSNVEIEADGITEWGWSIGALFNVSDKLNIGFNYRSLINMDAEPSDGSATFSNFPNSPLVPQNGTIGFSARLPLPAELSVGVSYRPSDKWIFNFDYNRAFWSAYRSLDIVFDDPNFAPAVSPRNYQDSDIFRFGLQYTLNDKLDLRAGYYYDDSPVQPGFFAPETPRNDSQGHTVGLSYHVNEKLSIDASFLYLRFKETEASFDPYFENGVQVPFRGTYKSNAFLPGIGVSYNF